MLESLLTYKINFQNKGFVPAHILHVDDEIAPLEMNTGPMFIRSCF